MTDTGQQRMILRRTDAHAASSGELADRVKASAHMTLLQENAPSTLLVEGNPDQIKTLVGDVFGWSALPMTTYQVPDARPRVLKPMSGR